MYTAMITSGLHAIVITGRDDAIGEVSQLDSNYPKGNNFDPPGCELYKLRRGVRLELRQINSPG
ncbi:hypothetical protein CEE69_00205 [Rhodopirellula bahusiensis]|uniref:Uncharacterized protein n=1 Tax=Rhodopirellula bahusiensis TaxID=2014065 RepID=A0A2G1WCV7_9BACT|nr:hypothetical protein CEE69_00205 [Rhodopirellula bahusiensis]